MLVCFINTLIVNSQTNITITILCANKALFSVVSTLMWSGTLKFPNGTIVLWAKATLPASVAWFGLGMYNSETYYNAGINSNIIFKL